MSFAKDMSYRLHSPREELLNVLRLSYGGLNYEKQQILLNIACFLKGMSKKSVVDLLDCCGFYAVIGMRSLLDKALITISSNNTVEMHDLIQQMSWEIVRQESPGKRSCLSDFDDACDVLKNNKGTEAIHGIMLDMSRCRNLCLSPDTFKKMPNLRYLRFFTSLDIDGRLCDLHIPTGLESLPDELRYLEWHACPIQSLPSNFCPENLVTLRMPHSQFKRLWSAESC
ncbi:disease resistance protein RPP2A-like [Arachis hypogaea]|uniref:disease resistance protein RPP2A-like n=1 Tax=Arachis hypogaea TaxID=3818 RepID=UPI0010FC6271|nr:disease resistance protein RPP2A-like [Arachis hypogaea]